MFNRDMIRAKVELAINYVDDRAFHTAAERFEEIAKLCKKEAERRDKVMRER